MSDDDKKTDRPDPEEMSRKLQEFLKSNFGGNVFSFAGGPPSSATKEAKSPPPVEEEEGYNIFDFSLRPRDVKAHLDRFVIRQDDAKKALSIAVCDHYNHAKIVRKMEEEDPEAAREIEFHKQNVIILGPTGVGKTYLVKHIAELIGVPFVKADATKFSETGYVGADVDDLVRDLVKKANGDVDLAEYGIIYIDEVDKLASQASQGARDVSGRGVQTTLLKLMEETEVALRNPMDIQSQMQAMMEMQRGGAKSKKDTINTRHILFIVSGAFSGLNEIVTKRLRSGEIGFGARTSTGPEASEVFRHSSTQDFIDYGFEAEFIGRLPVRVVCDPLKARDLFEIMKTSEGSLIRQYEREFSAYGISAVFDEEALHLIAERAVGENTGARGLVTVCERLLRDYKFELPGTSVNEILINRWFVENPHEAIEEYRRKGAEVCLGKVREEMEIYARKFEEKYGVKLLFQDDAVEVLSEKALSDNLSAMQLGEHLFKDYQFGLKLIQKNTGREEFVIDRAAIEDPEGTLSRWVVESYNRAEAPRMEP
ncbi:MAG: AAA family ATPase [Verrucomicrobiota bacterium]